jgi:hypothetical protein
VRSPKPSAEACRALAIFFGALRLAELVRYETEGRHARYRLKHPREVRRILDALSGFVKTTSVNRR